MKKIIALVLSLATVLTLVVGCGDVQNTTSTTLTAPDIVGSWAYVAEDQQNVFTFNEDGTLFNQVYAYGCYSRENKGTYTTDGSNTKIKLDKQDIDAAYSFDGFNNLIIAFNGQTYTYHKVKPFTTDEYKEDNGYFTGLWADVPTPIGMFTDSHFADKNTAYNYEIKESTPTKAKYGVNYNYFFSDEADATEAFSKYYTYLLEDKFSLPKDSKDLKKKIKKLNLDRDVEKESEFEISRNILVNNYTGEEIGIGLCFDKNEKRVVLSVTLFNNKFNPDDYVADKKIKINYEYLGVVVTKHRSNINPNEYHIVSKEVVVGGQVQKPSSTTSTSSQQPSSDVTINNETVSVNVKKIELPAAFKSEAEGAKRSESVDDHVYDGPTDAAVIALNNVDTVVNLEMGTKGKFNPTTTPSENVDTAIRYESTNEKIAIVDKDGNIYAMSPGCVRIIISPYDGRNGVTEEAYVNVYATKGNETESNKFLELVNNERKSASLKEYTATVKSSTRPQDENKLMYIATQRAYEEAYENDGKMDSKRPDGSDHKTIFAEGDNGYNFWTRGNQTYYAWGKNYDAKKVFDEFKASDAAKSLINGTTYPSMYAGCYTDSASGVSFWCIMLANVN